MHATHGSQVRHKDARVEEREGEAAVALGGVALDGDGLHGRSQRARHRDRAQQRPQENGPRCCCGDHKPGTQGAVDAFLIFYIVVGTCQLLGRAHTEQCAAFQEPHLPPMLRM